MQKCFYIGIALLLLAGCKSLDRYPQNGPSSSTFYSNKAEIDLAIAALHSSALFYFDADDWTDNFWDRSAGGNDMLHGATTIQSSMYSSLWSVSYNGITRANLLLENMNRAQDVSEDYLKQAAGYAHFIRGYAYAMLALHFHDVPLITRTLTLPESYSIKRSPQAAVLQFAFDELDAAIAVLPVSYPNGLQYYTKGAALAIKARAALYAGNWEMAAAAAKAVMDLNKYALYSSYRDLFLAPGERSSEIILSYPRSAQFNVTYDVQYFLSRNAGGFASYLPTYELIDSYECTDGKPINESPLYNYKQPFNNRDPRLKATIVTPGEDWLGYTYQNHPDSVTVYSSKQGKRVPNNDCKTVNQYASYNGYLWKKGIDISMVAQYNKVDLDQIILRYAEILLIYAEAKIELNQIDQSVLDAINRVRARAYGVTLTQTDKYPAVTNTGQEALRKILRRERRVEFAREGQRYMDLIRWKIAEKAMNRPVYGSPLSKADYPFPGIPSIDEDGLPSYDAYQSKLSVLDKRAFNPGKNYIWPIPFGELTVNPGLGQNPGW